MASQQPAASSAAKPSYQPFVAAGQSLPEFTWRAVLLGMFFGLLFGAVSTYLGLRAGLTVSASIPIAVLAISIFKKLGHSSILENNIVQTAGSAGESIAAGVIFTLPALVFLGFPLEYSRIFLLAMIGGWLGILFMIPLRRQLIVAEHGTLAYPEGTACADVLKAGERGGNFAGRVFWGLAVGGVYKFLMDALQFWKGTPDFQPAWFPGASFRADVTPEYLGVGYIIGPRTAGTLFAGGVLSWWVIAPAIKFFGGHFPSAIYPSTIPVAQMTPDQIWSSYIRPIGAGAVAAAGLITLIRTIPTIYRAFRGGLRDLQKSRAAGGAGATGAVTRLEKDLPAWVVLAGSGALAVLMWAVLALRYNTQAAWFSNVGSALLVVVFGFFFVTVSSRIVGLIGSSSNPVSGMTIATLVVTCLCFIAVGWTKNIYGALALSIGGVVAIAAANAGGTSQDLKTGFLVGATPWKQQLALMFGVIASVVVVGYTVPFLNAAYASYVPEHVAMPALAARTGPTGQPGVSIESLSYTLPAGVLTQVTQRRYWELNVIGSHVLADGKYLYNPRSGAIEVQWVQGIGSEQVAAPQARLMATIINGLLSRQLPWALILIGVCLVIGVEILGVNSLAFAVGSYLSVGTTAAMFAGGVVRWLAERGRDTSEEGDAGSGALYSSGLIAGAAVFGLVAAAIAYFEAKGELPHGAFAFGPKLLGPLAQSNAFAVLVFLALCVGLYRVGRRPLFDKPSAGDRESGA